MRKRVNFKDVKGHLPKDDKHGKQDNMGEGQKGHFIQKGFFKDPSVQVLTLG